MSLDHSQVVAGGATKEELWARLENRGAVIPSGRMRFTVWDAAGEVVWSAWYGDQPILGASRRTVGMIWHPDQAPTGTYSYGFTVSDEAAGTVYAQVRARDTIAISG